VLKALAPCYDKSAKGCFTKDALNAVMAAVKSDPELAGENEKTLMKMVMPFSKFMMEKAATAGPSVLDVKLPFGEAATLTENLAYMMRSLKLDALEVKLCDGAAPKPQECDNVYPGNPALVISQAPATS